ncbi:MAG: PIN domain-containing protein [Gemmatimonadales bacterium]
MIKVAIDTNVLLYAEGLDDALRRQTVLELLRRMPQGTLTACTVVLGEFVHVLTHRGKRSASEARRAVSEICDAIPPSVTSVAAFAMALNLAVDHRLGIWDALILASAAESGCRLLLSEDYQEGFSWNGVTVTSPFRSPRHPLLEAMLLKDGEY